MLEISVVVVVRLLVDAAVLVAQGEEEVLAAVGVLADRRVPKRISRQVRIFYLHTHVPQLLITYLILMSTFVFYNIKTLINKKTCYILNKTPLKYVSK